MIITHHPSFFSILSSYSLNLRHRNSNSDLYEFNIRKNIDFLIKPPFCTYFSRFSFVQRLNRIRFRLPSKCNFPPDLTVLPFFLFPKFSSLRRFINSVINYYNCHFSFSASVYFSRFFAIAARKSTGNTGFAVPEIRWNATHPNENFNHVLVPRVFKST